MHKHYDANGISILPVLLTLCLVVSLALATIGMLQNSKSSSQFSTAAVSPNTKTTTSAASSTQVSSADQTTAKTNASSIVAQLEIYFAVNGYYPSSVSPQEFNAAATGGQSSGTDPVTLMQQLTTTPSGVTYEYTATPGGCTTAAHDCQHYNLTVVDSNNTIIVEKKDLNT